MNVQARRSPKDFASDQEVRWCPGCGNYSIIKAVQKVLADVGAEPEKTTFVSGIGCAARFPYYMETYGFHTIHGRAAAVATGVKLANPDLDVWVVSGDGDSLAIGGNHLLHLLRRNADLTYLLLNNEIYGLTKGQASPTSRHGTHSPTTPFGSVDLPVNPAAFALGSGARFVARAVDTVQKHLVEVLRRAHDFHGTGFVEIFQNCIVFNDGVFEELSDKRRSADNALYLEHGAPMVFGSERDKGLKLNTETLELDAVTLGENGATVSDLVVHDETNRAMAGLLARLSHPMPIGVLFAVEEDTFMDRQQPVETDASAIAECLRAAMHAAPTWDVR
jgi:2-oxoglutarate/2-oxoacid ferredoxin oxidoreductase subunit beta